MILYIRVYHSTTRYKCGRGIVSESILWQKSVVANPLPVRPLQRLANKRKLFEKAQLKRQYAKLLKKEAASAGGGGEHEAEAAQSDVVADAGGEERAALSPKRKRKEEAKAVETKHRRDGRDGREKGQRERGTTEGGQQQGKPGKRKRPEPRPDPFKGAKVKHLTGSFHARHLCRKALLSVYTELSTGQPRLSAYPPIFDTGQMFGVARVVQRSGSVGKPLSATPPAKLLCTCTCEIVCTCGVFETVYQDVRP